MDSEGRLTTLEGHCLDDYDHFGPDDLAGKLGFVSITYYPCHMQYTAALVSSES
jgi:hypothetical protein